MAIISESSTIILPAIAALALFSLANSQPSYSAIILFIEAILIDVYLGITQGVTSTTFGASILLTFFCLSIIGCNFYLELSFKKTTTKLPKLNIIICLILFALFWRFIDEVFINLEQAERLYFLNLNYDALSLIVSGFSLFAILVSSLIIFDLKNPRPGEQS